jgi:hypothetical protein
MVKSIALWRRKWRSQSRFGEENGEETATSIALWRKGIALWRNGIAFWRNGIAFWRRNGEPSSRFGEPSSRFGEIESRFGEEMANLHRALMGFKGQGLKKPLAQPFKG